MARILVVDDEPKLGRLVEEALGVAGHQVTRASGGVQALALLEAEAPFDLVLTDLKMPQVDGLAVLAAALERRPAPEVVLMTAFGTAEAAVSAMKAGAADYLTKPFSLDELRMRVGRLCELRSASRDRSRLLEALTPALVAESAAMRRVVAAVERVAPTDATVLLLGESGTGKSQLARYLHYRSPRASGAFVEVHCAALSETLLESELFGHEKGAFTGAHERRAGHLAAADGGTLFLDEIGEVSLATQVKLLRFLQAREYVPVGSTQARKVDLRVVAATNRDLGEAVEEGRFREDFYYRLNVFSVEVPPLRDRPEELLPLAARFLAARGLPISKLSPPAREWLSTHRWPGNVRELENALERAVILAGEAEIRPEDLASGRRRSAAGSAGPAELLREGFNLDAFERDLIHAAIERAGGNKSAAARLLGITRRRLYSRLESLGERLAQPASEDEER